MMGDEGQRGGEGMFSYPSLMEQPPPVPVTQTRVQNFAQSEGMRFAG